MLLRVWSRGQQAGHYLKACWKCRAAGLAPSLLHQSLNFNKTASSSSAPPWRCPLLPSSIRPSPGVVSCPGSVFQPHLVYFIPYKTELFLARSLGPEIVLRHTVTNTHRLTAMHTWIQATHTQTTHTHTHSLTHILHAPSALSLAGLFVCLLLVAVTVVPALGGTFGSMSLTICLPGTQHRDWHDTETQQMFVSEEERERTQVQGKGQDIEIRDCRGEKVGLC